jgi:hypothetical protein
MFDSIECDVIERASVGISAPSSGPGLRPVPRSLTGAKADCLSIRDYDKRQACLAEERRDPAGCTSIRDWDAREVCRQRAGQRDLFGSTTRDRDRWPR